MANRYWRPQKANDVYHPVDRHIPLPFEEVAGVLKERQNQYNQSLENDLKQRDIFNQFQTRNIDTPAKNAIVNNYNDEVKSILEKHGGDYGAANQDILGVTRKYASDQYWNRAQKALQQEQSYNKFNEDAAKQGKEAIHFNDSFKNTPVYDHEAGVYNDLTPHESQLHHDWGAGMTEATKLQANTFATALAKHGGDPAGYLSYSTINGITDGQVRKALGDSRERFLQGPEGKQMLRHLTENEGMSHSEAMREIDHGLLSAGMQQVHMNVTPHYAADKQYDDEVDLQKRMAVVKAKAAAKEGLPNMPQPIFNDTGKTHPLEVNAPLYNTNAAGMPYTATSVPLDLKFKQITPPGRTFIAGDGYSTHEASGDPLTNAVLHNVMAGWKVVRSDDPALQKKIGGPLTVGKEGLVKKEDHNQVKQDPQTGEHYVLDQDGKYRTYVQPQAYNVYSGTAGGDPVTAYEESSRVMSRRYLGGLNLSGDQGMIGMKDGKVEINPSIDTNYLSTVLRDNPNRTEILYRLNELTRGGINTEQDKKDFMTLQGILDDGEMKNVVIPGTTTSKHEFTPKTYEDHLNDKIEEDEE